jgi:hypothetical protein
VRAPLGAAPSIIFLTQSKSALDLTQDLAVDAERVGAGEMQDGRHFASAVIGACLNER